MTKKVKKVEQTTTATVKPAPSQEELEVRDANRVIDKGLLQMHYQPIVDVRTRSVFAQEALCRPRSRRLKSPVTLVAAAVRAGRIGELGRLQRHEAVKNCLDWPLFLNVEPHEFDQGWLVRPDDPVFRHRRPVYLEITETVPLKFFDQCHSVLSELRKKGVLLAIDDLGAGFSNLKYIAELEPDIVKLDRELVKGVRAGTRQFGLLASITRLCHEMQAKVVAEGVETEAELRALIEADVDYCQGYLLARPALPPPEISFPRLECAPEPEHSESLDVDVAPDPVVDLTDAAPRERATTREEILMHEIRALENRLEISERLREATSRLATMSADPALEDDTRGPVEIRDSERNEPEVVYLPSATLHLPKPRHWIYRLTVPLFVTAAASLAVAIFGGESPAAPIPALAESASHDSTSPATPLAVSSKKVPARAEPLTPPLPPRDSDRDTGRLAARVAAWAEAWSDQDLVRYFGFYSRDFQPTRGLSRDGWKQDRIRRLGKPSSITVTVKELTITHRYPNVARADFLQQYESDTYRDQVRKALLFARENGEWRIIREEVAGAG